jgi:hypothetical protein
MRTVPSGLATHLTEECTSLATLWKIERRDGVEYFFTDHDVDLVVSGDTYVSSSGFERTAIKTSYDFSTDNLDLTGFFTDSAIAMADVKGGLFNGARMTILAVNHQDTSQGTIILKRGFLGEVRMSPAGRFTAELRGLKQALSQKVGDLIQPECRVDLGSSKCSVPIAPTVLTRGLALTLGQFYVVVTDGAALGQAQYENRIYECTVAGTTHASVQPTYDETPGNTTVDGTATLKAYQAWTRHAVVATVTDNQTFTVTITESRAVNDWFNGGAVVFESGDNDGAAMEVKDWVQSSSTLTLFMPMAFNVQVGDRLRVYPGCDKRYSTCKAKWLMSGSINFPSGNGINFRGEPYLPGRDWLGRYPDSK